MIAASEKFLHQILPLGFHRDYMRSAALHAGMRIDTRWLDGNRSAPVQISGAAAADLIALMAIRIAEGGSEGEYQRARMDELIEIGTPLVGWSIDADNRRIYTPPQPGEGEFIKYLGRDF